ncbi:TPA: hypothetical protein ACQRQK_002018 [Pseudomonas aeruginosa]
MNKANECTCPSGDGSLVHPCPAHPAVEQAGGDRWDALQSIMEWTAAKNIPDDRKLCLIRNAARAALAQPSPAPELERPEVAEVAFVLRNIGAMDAEDIDGDNVDLRFEDAEGRDTGCDVSIVEYAEKAADLLEQQDRIVGELRADRDSWAEQAEQRLADWDEMRKERDAALARVAELAQALRHLLHNIKASGKRIDLGLAKECAEDALARIDSTVAAQAQHSGPEEFSFEYRHPNGESHTVTVSRDQVINEMPDFLFEALCSKFCNCEPAGETNVVECCCDEYAEEFKLLAAAPAQAQHSVPEGWMLVPVEPLLNMMSDKDHDTRITAERQLLSILAAAPGNSVPQAWLDVQAERRRQITAEGWTPEHDDLYCAAELPRAAAAYILNGANDEAPAIWPFVAKWWKPRDSRSNYVRAGALILAEIERLDRAAHGKEVGHE